MLGLPRYLCLCSVLLWYHILLMTVDEVCDPLRWPPRLNRVARIPCHAVGVEQQWRRLFSPMIFNLMTTKMQEGCPFHMLLKNMFSKYHFLQKKSMEKTMWHEFIVIQMEPNSKKMSHFSHDFPFDGNINARVVVVSSIFICFCFYFHYEYKKRL